MSWASVTLESHVHNQAATVSATVCAQADSNKSFEAFVDALQTMAREAEAAGAVVGHVKGFVRADGLFARVSVTDNQHAPTCEGDIHLLLDPNMQIQLAAIVMLIDLDDLERIVVEALEGL